MRRYYEYLRPGESWVCNRLGNLMVSSKLPHREWHNAVSRCRYRPAIIRPRMRRYPWQDVL